VRDVRVLGAIAAIELAGPFDRDALRARLVDAGVWVRPFGNIVYLTPAFTIGQDDLDFLIDAVVGVLQGMQAPAG